MDSELPTVPNFETRESARVCVKTHDINPATMASSSAHLLTASNIFHTAFVPRSRAPNSQRTYIFEF